MERGPIRSAAERSATTRPEARSAEEGQYYREETRAPKRGPTLPKSRGGRKLPWLIAGIVILLMLIIGAGVFAWTHMQQANIPGVDASKYQAVFFSNGQVYFGKLTKENDNYMKLTDIYYLQTQSTTDTNDTKTDSTNPQSNASGDVKLIKLGQGEIHAPEDEMIIAKDQVMFIENIKSDGKVGQAIQQYQSSKK